MGNKELIKMILSTALEVFYEVGMVITFVLAFVLVGVTTSYFIENPMFKDIAILFALLFGNVSLMVKIRNNKGEE